MAPVTGIDLAVDGFVRFYDGLRVNGNTQMDGELSVLLDTSLSGDLSLNGNDILTGGGDIKDNSNSPGLNNSFLISKGEGNGVRWVPVTAASFGAVTSDTTEGGSGSVVIGNMVKISQTDYGNLGTKDADTLYFIVG